MDSPTDPGSVFIPWYNQKQGSAFAYAGTVNQPGDLLFRDGDRKLRAEILTVGYDFGSGLFTCTGGGLSLTSPSGTHASEFHEALGRFITDAINLKTDSLPVDRTVLLIEVTHHVTTAHGLQEVLGELRTPSSLFPGYDGIYLIGRFPGRKRKRGIAVRGLEVRQVGAGRGCPQHLLSAP